MSPSFRILLAFVLLYQLIVSNAKTNTNGPNCQNFSRGVTFNESEAVGVWHLILFKTEKTKGSPGEPQCVEFSSVGKQEVKDLQEKVGKFIENLNWDTLSLKMQIPCRSDVSNKTRDYYLERLENNGSYRTLQMPPPSAKLDLAGFNRYPMRIKIVENQYLAMMDCHEKFVFLLGKQPEGKEVDDRLKKMLETYWPEE